jgi:hypothetical protein
MQEYCQYDALPEACFLVTICISLAQVPGLPISVPRSLLPTNLAAAPGSLWGRLLVAAIGTAAAVRFVVGLTALGGGVKQQLKPQEVEAR